MPRAPSTSTSTGPPPWAIPPRSLPGRVMSQPPTRRAAVASTRQTVDVCALFTHYLAVRGLRSGRSVRKSDALPNRLTDRTRPTGGRSVLHIAALAGSPTGYAWRHSRG